MSVFLQKLKKAAYIALLVLVCECIVGSSGRWLVIGPLSIRMWLFVITFLLSLPFVIIKIKELIKNSAVISILVFAAVVCAACFIGLANGHNIRFILADLSSVAFLAIIPAFLCVLDDQKRIDNTLKIASFSSLVLVCITVALHFIFIFMNTGTIEAFNYSINSIQIGGLFSFDDQLYRIFFRSSICFILPLIYFFNQLFAKKEGLQVKTKNLLPYTAIVLSFIAIILTYTRSIWFGAFTAMLVLIIMNIKQYKAWLKGITVMLAGFMLFVALSWAGYGYEGVLTNVVQRISLGVTSLESVGGFEDQYLIQLESEEIRAKRIEETNAAIQDHLVFGNGLGLEINDGRPGVGKIEYTYLDIVSKMGLVGLIVFFTMLAMPYIHMAKRFRRKEKTNVMTTMMCVLAGFVTASIFNPFITNPIGFSLYGLLVSAAFVKKNGETTALLQYNELKNEEHALFDI